MIAGRRSLGETRCLLVLKSPSGKIKLMTKPGVTLPLLLVSLTLVPALAQQSKKPMTGSAARGAASSGMPVAPDLTQRLAKFKPVPMPFRSAGLTEREKKLVGKL